MAGKTLHFNSVVKNIALVVTRTAIAQWDMNNSLGT